MPQESNRKKIIIVGLLLVIIAVIVSFFILRGKTQQPASDGTTADLFPYGTTTGGDTPSTGDGSSPINPDIPPGTDQVLENPILMASSARLRQITNYPVTGFIATQENRQFNEPKLDEKTNQTIFTPIIRKIDKLRWNVKQTGILLDAEITKDSITQYQKTTTQIPLAEEISFLEQGRTAVFRFWNDNKRTIDSYRGTLPKDPELDYCLAIFTQELRQGARGDSVAELQKYLAKKTGTTMVADGSFGSGTVTALKKAQELFGVEVTGILDEATRNEINRECTSLKNEYEALRKKAVELPGAFLASDILRVTPSPDGTQLFALLEETGGGVTGIVMNADGSNKRKIFASVYTEWMPLWVNSSSITMTTLASREAYGYVYSLDPASGNMRKLMGPLRGLTTQMNPAGTKVLYGTSTDTGFNLGVYNTADGSAKSVTPATLPEKCTWMDNDTIICGIPTTPPNAQYPDAWYQGIVSFGDSLWQINITTGTTQLLLTPEQRMDMVQLAVSPGKDYVYFINKNDETLWSLRISE